MREKIRSALIAVAGFCVATTLAVSLSITTTLADGAMPPRLVTLCDDATGMAYIIAVSPHGIAMWPRLKPRKGIVPVEGEKCP